jgi:hypothetical protein
VLLALASLPGSQQEKILPEWFFRPRQGSTFTFDMESFQNVDFFYIEYPRVVSMLFVMGFFSYFFVYIGWIEI